MPNAFNDMFNDTHIYTRVADLIPSDNSRRGSMVVIINGEKWRIVNSVSFAVAPVGIVCGINTFVRVECSTASSPIGRMSKSR